MNQYSKLNTKQLAELYFITKANYGKISGDLLDEIDNRGGEASFLEQIKLDESIRTEKARIREEVFLLMANHHDTEFLKKMIHSELISRPDLDRYIEETYQHLTKVKANNSVDAATVFNGLMGLLIATLASTGITLLHILLTTRIFYPILVVIYMICWFIIRSITKKDSRNIIVLLFSLIATILGPIIILLLSKR